MMVDLNIQVQTIAWNSTILSDSDFVTRVMDTLALPSQKLAQLRLQVEGGAFPFGREDIFTS
jgi:hypothetical protein